MAVENGERNGAQRRTKVSHDASTGAAAVAEKVRLRMKRCLAVKKSSLTIIKIRLSEGIS